MMEGRAMLRWAAMRVAPSLMFALASACTLVGCALIHHDTAPVAEISAAQITLADDIHLAHKGWPSARWWTRYQDPQLDALIEQALTSSPTIAIARSRVSEARAQVELIRAGTDLQVSGRAAVDRARVSGNGFLSAYSTNNPGLGATGPWYTTGLVGVDGRLSIDIWGKDRAQVEAAIGEQNANRASEAAAELEISTDVVRLYYAIQTTYASLDLLRQAREIAAFVKETHAARYARGLEGEALEQQAEASVLLVDRRLASTEQQITQSREALRALVGADAHTLPAIDPRPLPSPAASLPASLSYELLARRPDLQALRWYVQSSFDTIDAAKASFYPSFDIAAFIGFDALHLSDLFLHTSHEINLIPGLYLPIFDSGKLNANLHRARSVSDALIDQYNQAVLNAVRDVAQAASRLQDIEQETTLQTGKIATVVFLQDSADARYARGIADKTTAQEAREPVITEQLSLVELNGQAIDQEVALVRALGGGYCSDAPADPAPR